MSELTGGLVSVTFRQLPPAAVVDLTAQAELVHAGIEHPRRSARGPTGRCRTAGMRFRERDAQGQGQKYATASCAFTHRIRIDLDD